MGMWRTYSSPDPHGLKKKENKQIKLVTYQAEKVEFLPNLVSSLPV
jgi:hypothetical protein